MQKKTLRNTGAHEWHSKHTQTIYHKLLICLKTYCFLVVTDQTKSTHTFYVYVHPKQSKVILPLSTHSHSVRESFRRESWNMVYLVDIYAKSFQIKRNGYRLPSVLLLLLFVSCLSFINCKLNSIWWFVTCKFRYLFFCRRCAFHFCFPSPFAILFYLFSVLFVLHSLYFVCVCFFCFVKILSTFFLRSFCASLSLCDLLNMHDWYMLVAQCISCRHVSFSPRCHIYLNSIQLVGFVKNAWVSFLISLQLRVLHCSVSLYSSHSRRCPFRQGDVYRRIYF